ncbi:CHAT domain-containing protein [Streptomyces sp. JHA26]|uniref:CHAT domain-containing protein n=1 Tax=Streptomyces sp. JHA26 TaxID=1917143 RepID=UPI0035CEB9C0
MRRLHRLRRPRPGPLPGRPRLAPVPNLPRPHPTPRPPAPTSRISSMRSEPPPDGPISSGRRPSPTWRPARPTGWCMREQVIRRLGALIQDGTLNWWARLENVTRELWDAVLGPVTEVLGQGPVTLIRSGYLELLPTNAAWTPAPDRPGGRRYVIDELPIRTVPNARVLATAVARAGQTSVLAVQDPQPVSAAPLKQAAVEVAGAVADVSVDLVGDSRDPGTSRSRPRSAGPPGCGRAACGHGVSPAGGSRTTR